MGNEVKEVGIGLERWLLFMERYLRFCNFFKELGIKFMKL